MKYEPIANILRPKSLDEFIGQEHLVGDGRALRIMIDKGMLKSVIFYGPPGTGKTSLAHIIANMTDYFFSKINATASGIKEIREIIKVAESVDNQTVLFLDEIANLNKTQQDVLLPSVEDGRIILIGATTQNPFFSINGPLVSRSQIFEFEFLKPEHIRKGVLKVIEHYREHNRNVNMTQKALDWVIKMCGGDLRRAMNSIQSAVDIIDKDDVTIKEDVMKEIMPIKGMIFDGHGDDHFDGASCLQGAIQASDPDAAIYWLAKLVASGENPDYICRRLLISSAEDVGIGNPLCMVAMNAASDMVRKTGIEGDGALALAVAVTMMATSKRNKSVAEAYWSAQQDVKKGLNIAVPKEMKDSHYIGAKNLGHGAYHDGMNQSSYVGINKKYYKPI